MERAGQSNRRELMNFSGVSTGSSSLKVDICGRNATVWFSVPISLSILRDVKL